MGRNAKANTTKKTSTEVLTETFLTSVEKVNSKKERKIKFQLYAKKLEERVVLKESQKEYSEKIRNNSITFATGPAGTSKTFTACYTLLKMLFEGKIEKIIFTKPVKESGENLGFLPGGIDEKMAPYVESFIFTCKEMLGEEIVLYLLEQKYIECKPLAYMRGITFNNCGLFCDESQNCLAEQLILYITRLGHNSKMIISGDMTQRDIEKRKVVFNEFIDMIKEVPGVVEHKFTREDIVRNPILIEITERYEEWKEKKGL